MTKKILFGGLLLALILINFYFWQLKQQMVAWPIKHLASPLAVVDNEMTFDRALRLANSQYQLQLEASTCPALEPCQVKFIKTPQSAEQFNSWLQALATYGIYATQAELRSTEQAGAIIIESLSLIQVMP